MRKMLLIIAALCCFSLPALTAPDKNDLEEVSAVDMAAVASTGVPVQATGDGWVITIGGERVTVQRKAIKRALTAADYKDLETYRQYWRSKGYPRLSTSQEDGWKLLRQLDITHTGSGGQSFYKKWSPEVIDLISQVVYRLLNAVDWYINMPSFRIEVPVYSLPGLGPLPEVKVPEIPEFTKVGGAMRPKEGCDIQEINCPKVPDMKCNTVTSTGGQLVNPGLQLPSTTKTRESSIGYVVWTWDKETQRFKAVQPPGDVTCDPNGWVPDPTTGGVWYNLSTDPSGFKPGGGNVLPPGANPGMWMWVPDHGLYGSGAAQIGSPAPGFLGQ